MSTLATPALSNGFQCVTVLVLNLSSGVSVERDYVRTKNGREKETQTRAGPQGSSGPTPLQILTPTLLEGKVLPR